MSLKADSFQQFRSRVLRDVAWGPSVKAGASVPSYSGGLAAWMVVSDSDFLSLGSLTPEPPGR
jgi:hypothetical protein